MTDMIAGQNVPCSSRQIAIVDNLRAADEGENNANKPTREQGEYALADGEHLKKGLQELA